ncbi:MAG: hypothetical protein M1823_001820 [Watsoniomyces obsoletus]|nr:MAG: hypothetical protein M1823_001820 [Watsoniomyces obsoletus]
MASSVSSMEIITLNCWGLKYLSAYRRERLSEIGHQLAIRSPAPEIVGLQECWTQEDYLSIREQTRNILPHGKFYYGGIFGAGLAILSKWPIVESSMVAYPLNGRPTAFFRGDWFVGKGVACAKIRYGNRLKDVVELHAPYEREPHDSYLCHRTAQAWEISKLMRNAIERGHLTIALGDFNMKPLSLAHRIITTHAPVLDAWLVRHPERISQETLQWSDVHSAFYNIVSAGTTCDSALNTWRWPKRQQRALMKNRGEKWPPEMVREDEDGGLMKDPYAKSN